MKKTRDRRLARKLSLKLERIRVLNGMQLDRVQGGLHTSSTERCSWCGVCVETPMPQ